MPDTAPVIQVLDKDSRQYLVEWSALANGIAGVPVSFPRPVVVATVQVSGNFGAGGKAVMEGSNLIDKSAYAALTNMAGAALEFTAAGMGSMAESPLFIRPRISAGDGNTSLKVSMVVYLL